jgi:D-glutamate cyclase
MIDDLLRRMRDLIQVDVGHRGLRTDPADNLVTACPDDFARACRSIGEGPDEPSLVVVTGFFIPTADPPAGETDGPLGALFLARAFASLTIQVTLVTDGFCRTALEAGLSACGLADEVPLVILPAPGERWDEFLREDWQDVLAAAPTHLIALERVGPSHTPDSVRAQPGATQETVSRFWSEVPAEHHDRCRTMRGRDITALMSPAHRLFEVSHWLTQSVRTIGIGDGGNEIGMGKIGWDVIRRNIPGGGLVACRVPTDDLIVCGVSNWGAYALAAGAHLLRGIAPDRKLFDPERERELLRVMVERGPLVDGVTGRPTVSVDGLPFEEYVAPLCRLDEML